MGMKQVSFFREESAVAARQAKTDPLFLARTLKDAAENGLLPADDVAQTAHQILIKWADLDSSGQLARKSEIQLQGDCLQDIFGKASDTGVKSTTPRLGSKFSIRTSPTRRPMPFWATLNQEYRLRPKSSSNSKVPRRISTATAHKAALPSTNAGTTWSICRPTAAGASSTNFVSFRLYERNSTKRVYEHFTLQSLRDPTTFRKFYALFHRKASDRKDQRLKHVPDLLKSTTEVQRKVSEELYQLYAENRIV